MISPISKTENVMIDRAFISEKNGLRLRTIKECLVICGKDVKNKGDRKWFNKEVRAKWHKALKYWNENATVVFRIIQLSLEPKNHKNALFTCVLNR